MIRYVDHLEDNAALSWGNLARTLGGSFTARARGLVSPGLALFTPANEPFGQLLGDAAGPHFRAGDLEAEIRQGESNRYTMTIGDTEILASEPAGSPTILSLSSGDRLYEARISLLSNRATARSSAGAETARLSGGLTNRRYRAIFDPEDPTSLPIAIFLLHQIIELRGKAYRTR